MHTRVVAIAFLAAACGGSTTPPGGANCTVTFSGALTGSGACVAAGGNGYKSGSSGNGFGIVLNASLPTVQSFSFALDLGSNAVAASTYSNTATTAPAGAAVTTNGNQAWFLSSHASNGSPDQGTYTLSVSSLGSGISASGGTAYTAMTGTLTATLKPVTATGASGDVTVNVSF